jgi:hypothetical protein
MAEVNLTSGVSILRMTVAMKKLPSFGSSWTTNKTETKHCSWKKGQQATALNPW